MHPFFINYPEEVVNQPFTLSRVDTSSNEKEDYILSSTIINEIFLNYSVITQEESQLNVLKNIIIPHFSQTIFAPNSNITNSKLIFNFYESLSNLFLEKYKTYLSEVKFLKKSKIDFSSHATQKDDIDTIENLKNNVQMEIQKHIISNTLYISFLSSAFKSDNIIQIIDNNPIDSNILGYSFIWSIYHSNLNVLLKCFEKTFLFKKVDIQKFKTDHFFNVFNEKTVIFEQDFPQSIIKIDQNMLESNIIYDKSPLNSDIPQSCSFAAMPSFLLVYNTFTDKQQSMHFLKINICNHNVTENNRYIKISNSMNTNYFVQSIGNDALIYDKNGKLYLNHHESQSLNKFVQIKQSFFQHMPFPFTTDGYYIYSIHNNKEIGVYEIDKNKHVLTFIKKIIINDHKNNITEPYNDSVISNELLKKANIITNGVVIEFIVYEKIENNNFIHFARCISLVTGNHIRDFHFSLPFPIHSMSFDPISKRIWTLTIRKEESIFNQFKYRGPEPFWLSKFEVTSLYNSSRFSNYYGFVEVFINYVHSIVCQFFGSDFNEDDEIPAFLTSISDTEAINLILCLLDLPPNNYKYVEILFVLLSFQFKYNKVTKEQIKYLSNTIKKYLKKPDLYNFLIMFVIDITSNLKSQDASMFFELILESSDRNIHDMDLLLNLLLRYENSKKFPYILDNNYHLILHELLNQLNDETISMIGINFLMAYQSSLFLNYARIYQTKTLKIQRIENIIVYYTSSFFCNASLFIQNVKSIQHFDRSFFSLILKKLLMDLRLTAHLSSFILALLPILLSFLKEISKLQLFEENVENSFYVFYLYVFSLYVFCFKRMFSFSNIDVIKNHYPLLDVQMQKEKTVSDIFESKLNDDDFTNVINTVYNKVSNPLNKHLSSEDKEVEKNLFLSLIYKTNSIKEICTLNDEIKVQNNIKIPQSIRQIAQTIYKIRSNLRFKKQNGTQNDYLKLLNNYIEKSHFLLQFHSEKFSLKEISNFLNDNVKVSQIIQEQTKLESVKKNLDLFIPMFNSFITKDLPTNLIYFFIMNIASSKDILSANEIVNKYVTINLETSKDLIHNLIEQMTIMPPNAIISLVIYLFFVLLTSFKPEAIHEVYYFSISKMLSKLIEISKTTEEIVFKSCISIICHLNNIFNKEKLFIMTTEEKENITKILNDLELKYSMSLELAHSLFVGSLSNNNFSFNVLTQLMGFVGQQEFHQMSLLVYDYLQLFSDNNQEKDFMKLFEQILDIIGTVLSGSCSNQLLQVAIPIHQIQEAKNEKFILTPTSQLACVLDLIQIIRRFILQSESNANKMILNHFKWIFEHFQPDYQQYMKYLYAILSVMSNMIEILRPYSLVKTNDNKTYFITELDEGNNKVKGLLLPLSKQQFYKHELDFSSDLKSFEIIQYNLALLKDFELPFSLFKKALNLENKEYSYSLFKIYTLQWIKNNILDSENGKEFTEKFFNKIKNRIFKNFVFSDHLDIILTILKKSLVLQTDGVFTNSIKKPKLHHISFTNIIFENDYSLTETEIRANKSPHVFISSIINDSKPIFFGIKYTKLTCNFIFGIIVHSIEHNKMISIKYSSKDSQFSINGEKKSEYKLKANTLIECLYFPFKNLVLFADSNNENAIFSVDLGQRLKCSFFILVYPASELQYYCDLTPQTDCFKNHQNSKFSNIKHGTTTTSLLFQKDYQEELEGIIHYTCDFKEIRYQRKNSLNLEESNLKIQTLFTLTELTNLPETDLFMTNYSNSYFYSLLSNICSTPFQLDQYVQIHDVSGTFNLIDQQSAIIENSNSIPALDIQKYQNLPSEILNYYMNEASELYQKEIMTLFAVQVFANSKDIYSSLNHFSMSTLAIVNFITSILFLLEPIKFSNLHHKKSPIDFVEFNGLETCAKTDLYDYYTALTQIIDFITEYDLEKFIYKWFNQLQKDFRSKYMHFVSQKNNNVINVRSSITKEHQCFNLENVSGWIVFPYKFGCYKIQQISIDNAIFPKLSTDKANYFYSEKKKLKIKPITIVNNNDSLTTFGIIPLYNKSNESLFYSFYHLAVSFKYFVLFSHKNMPSKMKHKIWKLVINSIAAGSPFFYSHSYEVLLFLQKKLQLELNQENISILNSLHISNSLLISPSIRRFLFYQSFYLNNELSRKLEYHVFEKDQMPPKDIKVNNPIIPSKLDNSVNTEVLVDVVSTILLYKDKNNENHFPYHLILNEWVDSFLHFPPSTVENIGNNVVKITFLAFIPTSFQLITTGFYNHGDLYISNTNNFSKCTEKFNIYNLRTSSDYLNQFKPIKPDSTNNIYYVKFLNLTNNIENHHFKVYSYFYNRNKDISEIVYTFRNFIKNDFKDFNTKFTKSDDQKILNCVDSSKFSNTQMETRPTMFEVAKMISFNHPLYLNNLRAIYLFTINYLFLNEKTMSEKLSENNSLERFFSNGIFSSHFRRLIDIHNSNDYISMVIDRQKGLDYRNGINNLVSNSMIAQFTESYIKKPNSFRNKSKPFQIRYDNERGIDAGGLMRDFFTELINDLKTPRVGLFIQTPNGRNHEGNYQDCLVPSPAPEISKSDRYYQSIGALIAIAIRTEMKQPDLIFPSFFWSFLITGKLKIDDVYEIDKSYKDVTTNLLTSANNMTDEEFENLISITTIFDLRGNPINLGNHSTNSSSIHISKSNCARFVAICNDYRLNELINPLQKIKDGFWQNLAIEPPPFVTPSLLELMACGNRIITVEDLRAVTRFNGVAETQKNFFWETVTRMNNDERKKLIHFSTGLNSLNSRRLSVDSLGNQYLDHLPTASTCFFSLHLPPYSNADRMYNAFVIAINETGTFENA